VQPRHGVIPDAIRKLDSVGVAVDDIVLHRPTLDDVFIALTGHAAEEETPEEEKEVAAA
jgi:ABC-2 type transport system ATP-binding protein